MENNIWPAALCILEVKSPPKQIHFSHTLKSIFKSVYGLFKIKLNLQTQGPSHFEQNKQRKTNRKKEVTAALQSLFIVVDQTDAVLLSHF